MSSHLLIESGDPFERANGSSFHDDASSEAATIPDEGPTSEPAEERIVAGHIELDLVGQRLSVKGQDVRATSMQIRLLVYLIGRRDRLVTRADLLRDVWGYRATVHTRTVDIHVHRLRTKLRGAGTCIVTVRGFGYRFSAPA